MRQEWVAVLVIVAAVGVGAVLVGRAATGGGAQAATEERLLKMRDNRYVLEGWKHQGKGGFTLDEKAGVLKTHGGMGLLYYSAKPFGDFTLELDFRCADSANSGIFLRVPAEPTSDDYIYHSFEIQIDGAAKEGIHRTGAVYDAEAPKALAAKDPDEKPEDRAKKWNHFAITFRGSRITVALNDEQVVDWDAVPRGKVKDFAARGFIGLQNHDDKSVVEFRNLVVRELR
jgi:hypothetical protein